MPNSKGYLPKADVVVNTSESNQACLISSLKIKSVTCPFISYSLEVNWHNLRQVSEGEEKKNHCYGWLLKKEMKQMCYGLVLKLESILLYIA